MLGRTVLHHQYSLAAAGGAPLLVQLLAEGSPRSNTAFRLLRVLLSAALWGASQEQVLQMQRALLKLAVVPLLTMRLRPCFVAGEEAGPDGYGQPVAACSTHMSLYSVLYRAPPLQLHISNCVGYRR